MKQTLMVKLATTREQFEALRETMHCFNEACNFIADVAFREGSANKIRLQPLVYFEVRKKFNLSSQMAVRAIAKACEAFKRDKKRKPKFRLDGGVVYDQRILSWKGLDSASLLTTHGRIRVPVRMGEYQRARLDRIRGQADLILRNKTFYLAVVVEAPEATLFDPVGVLGVDLGVVNLAVDSDGVAYKGDKVERAMVRAGKLKAGLQACGSASAVRHLEKISGREQRFRRDVNHVISKRLVAKAKDTGRMIAVEDLGGIRSQTTVRKAQRRRHNSWAFRQLAFFIAYKAAVAGVPFIAVNPRGTSRTCPKCGCVEKRNRLDRDNFKCISCGHAGPADYVAAVNIAARGAVNRPIVGEHTNQLSNKPTNSFVGI